MLVGLIGQAQSGKDSVGDYLCKSYGFYKFSFAYKLKEACADIFELRWEQVGTAEGKATIDPRYDLTPRTILQKVGVGMREIYPNIWIDRLFNSLQARQVNRKVITDVRFLNEVKAIKERNGIVIRVLREDYQALKGKEAQHPSEMEQLAIPEELIDKTISAKSGELDKLYADVVDFLGGFDLCY